MWEFRPRSGAVVETPSAHLHVERNETGACGRPGLLHQLTHILRDPEHSRSKRLSVRGWECASLLSVSGEDAS
jgi:hypothetical protein